MTTTPEKTDLVTLTIDGVQVSVPKDTLVIRAAEQVGVADPALLRPPAARPRRRLPPVPRRHPRRRQRQADPQAAGLLHDHGRRGHGRRDPGDEQGRRQGAAGDHGVPAHQPPARLPGLRQGRRVPPAEPGHVQRSRRDPLRRASSAPSPSRSTSRRRCCSTASAASCASAAPASPTRSPVTRSSR